MHDIFRRPPFCIGKCQCPVDEKLAADLCKRYKFLAAKTIRVQSVLKIPENVRKSLKVILLVRDPRAIAASRVNQGSGTAQCEKMIKCKNFYFVYPPV